jgi:hypothetical protein
MTLWNITSYRRALIAQDRRDQAIARLRHDHGRLLWRWRAPLGDRLAVRQVSLPVVADARADRSGGLPQPPAEPKQIPPTRLAPNANESALSHRDQRLVEAAAAILQDARDRGVIVSQATLGRMLRGQGLPVANERLRWLFATAGGCRDPGTGR